MLHRNFQVRYALNVVGVLAEGAVSLVDGVDVGASMTVRPSFDRSPLVGLIDLLADLNPLR